MSTKVIPSREAGKQILEAPAKQAESVFQTLAPYLSHRLLLESEVAGALLSTRGKNSPETVLQELCLRTYWKSWLEGHPSIYAHWRRLVAEDSLRWPKRDEYKSALEGKTGLEAFDAWIQALYSVGYLSYQERRCFASIWIFTLRLPWSLGASLFAKHLLDTDTASNLILWRTVAGLQNSGQHFLATARDIEQCTGVPFSSSKELVKTAKAITGPGVAPYHDPITFPFNPSEQLGEEYAVLLCGDDLAPEIGALSGLKPKLVIRLSPEDLTDDCDYSPRVKVFTTAALLDASKRAEETFSCPGIELRVNGDGAAALGELMKQHNLSSLVYFEPFIGPWKVLTAQLSSRDVGVRYFPLRRSWDGLLQPHSSKSYLNFKKRAVPQIVRAKDLS